MKALIVAAGTGSRLKHRFSPKPLAPIFQLPIIERIILASKFTGINQFKIVVGYKADEIMNKIGNGEKYGVHIDYIFNPEWKKANGVSVLKAKEHLKEEFILLMSDHIFDESILRKLQKVELEENHCILCIDYDLKGNHFSLDDVTKVWVEDGTIKKIGKEIEKFNAIDTGVFLCTPVIFDALEESVHIGEYSLSAANQILSNNGKLKALDVTGCYWVDIDDELAFKKAEKILLQHLTKPTDGPISKLLNRPLSTRISSKLVNYNITPNQITLFCFILGVLSAAFFYIGGYINIIIGGVLAQLSSIIDGCDGEIARLKFKYSKFGEQLDRVLDRYADALIILGMTHASWLVSSTPFVWLIGFFALMGTFMNSYTAGWYDKILESNIVKKQKSFRLGRDIRLFIIFVGALFNQLLFTLILLAISTNIEAIRRLFVLKHESAEKN